MGEGRASPGRIPVEVFVGTNGTVRGGEGSWKAGASMGEEVADESNIHDDMEGRRRNGCVAGGFPGGEMTGCPGAGVKGAPLMSSC